MKVIDDAIIDLCPLSYQFEKNYDLHKNMIFIKSSLNLKSFR